MCDGNLEMLEALECNADPIDILISKYQKMKEQQVIKKRKEPLRHDFKHTLLDQSIRLLNEIIKDLKKLR